MCFDTIIADFTRINRLYITSNVNYKLLANMLKITKKERKKNQMYKKRQKKPPVQQLIFILLH